MCGIIAVLRRRARRGAPSADRIEQALDSARDALPESIPAESSAVELLARLRKAGGVLTDLDQTLRGTAGATALLLDTGLAGQVEETTAECERRVSEIEATLDRGIDAATAAELEQLNAALVEIKDATWSILRDRLRNARAIGDLATSTSPSTATIEAFASVQTALSALDRLEVRGRDSAGVHVLVEHHGLDLEDPDTRLQLDARAGDGLFGTGSVRLLDTPDRRKVGFVYKCSAEIGELGDNVRALRKAITEDKLLHAAVAHADAEVTVLGHTRWASIGIISQQNAHPVDHRELDGATEPFVVASLNGDVDNHAELTKRHGLRIPQEITTDAKVIPVLVSRGLASGRSLPDAFRETVASFEGSVAIAASSGTAPGQLTLALRGSGQALYVGLCEDAFVVASEPYGVVEETSQYVRMDGETPGNPDNPTASQGQILVLDREHAGSIEGIERVAYDGTPLPLSTTDVHTAGITTRDIDRGEYSHYLLKEITESPRSMRKTLRGKIHAVAERLETTLDDSTLPAAIRQRLKDGTIRRLDVIGQGTAAVAGQGVAAIFNDLLANVQRSDGSSLAIRALPATELSGFELRDDMSDTLIVAISQSGTTTDTNRTVDLVRSRGAHVVAIVNRRNSDLCDKADGVLYTSDGRDVEMSVASTKAFYAQIAAGSLLGCELAKELGADPHQVDQLLRALRAMPDAMRTVLDRRDVVARAAAEHAPQRRYWALVGNGKNKIAAAEVRIKLSELCYKSIACDATEDKKHIDLSSEPLILVCAAGLVGSTADDVAKEVAIYRAHKAAPIVIATEGEARFSAALAVIEVPRVHPTLDFVLSAVAGHLFGYESALSIDRLAQTVREMRAAIERTISEHPASDNLLTTLATNLLPTAETFWKGLRAGKYDGQLEASTATRLTSLLRYALCWTPLEAFGVEHGGPGTPSTVIEKLTDAATKAIDELTRPIDAIKHQAKTVTVGISRSDEQLLTVPLVKELLATGVERDRIVFRDLSALASLDAAVSEVVGYTRYTVEWASSAPDEERGEIQVLEQGGIARDLPSRTAQNPELRGTKHQVAIEQKLLVAVGRNDQRTVILVPEIRGNRCVGLTLLHTSLHHRVSAGAARGMLRAYRDRYSRLRDAVLETEPEFREELFAETSVADLLTAPVHALADVWRAVSEKPR